MNSKALYGAVLLGTVASLFVACGDGDSTKILVCNSKQVTCLNAQGGEVCSADGTLKLPFSCGAGETCCDPKSGDDGCTDYQSGAAGENSSSVETAGCVGGCVPGTHECSSREVSRVCSDDGRSWIPVACAPGTGCDAETGVCVRTDEPDDTVTVCEIGQSTCVDGVSVKECEEDGSGWIYKPCPTGTACTDGECIVNGDVECVPNSGVCANGQTARICNAEGSGYDEVDCGDMQCLDGACRGPVCSMGEVRCDDVREGNVYSALLASNYNPLAVYTCNADGTAWTISECAPTEICVYDNIAATTVNAFIEDLKAAAANGDPAPIFDVPETSRAVCAQPECAAPYALREYDNRFGAITGGSFICGDPAGDDPLGSFSLCEGLPPYNNLHWANYVCPDGSQCSYRGAPNESEGSTEEYIIGPVCDRTCVPGSTACFSHLADQLGQILPTGEATITCNDDGEWDYGSVTSCAEALDTDLAREQWCGPNLQGTSNSYDIGTCMEPACAYWFGAYETYALPDGVGACGTDGQFYQCQPDGTFADPRSCSACQVATGAPGSGFPDTFAGYDPGTCVDCTEGQQQCIISSSVEGGTPFYRQCGNNGSISIVSCTDGAICHDFLDLDTGSDTYGLNRVVCGGECAPFDTECGGEFGKQIRDCGSDGTWGDFADCDEGACTTDNTTSGFGQASCEAECIPGTFSCPAYLGSQSVECMNNGRFDDLNPIDCDVDAGEQCRDDIGCSECDDGRSGGRPETRCNPDDTTQIQVCEDSSWSDPVTCPGAPGSCLGAGNFAFCAPDNSGNNGGAAGTAGTAGDAGSSGSSGSSGSGGAGNGGTAGSAGNGGTAGDTAGGAGTAGDSGFGGFAGVDLG